MEKVLNLCHDRPGRTCLYLQCPLNVLKSDFKSAVILQHGENAEYDPGKHDDLHHHDEHGGDIIRRIGCQNNAADQNKNDKNID